MKFSLHLSHAALLAGVSLGAMTFTLPAQAQSADEEDSVQVEETIVVVGSRRPGRAVADSNVPIDVIGDTALEKVGFTDINRQLQNLVPSFNFPQPSLVDGTEHVKPASLRGLAPDQTLVLINGRRRHPSALLNINGSAGRGSVSVDLNSIPSSAIKRIEILRDGASAQYGSDAIGGVMNIITKDADEGGSLTVTAGMHFTTLDGVPELTGVEVGPNGFPVARSSNRVQGIYGDDIERQDGESITIAYNQGLSFGENGFLNGTIEYTSTNRTNRGGADDGDTYPLLPNGEFDPREITTDRFRFLVGNPDTESVTALLNAGYQLGDSAEIYGSATVQRREAVSGAFFREASDEAFGIQSIYPDGFTPRINSDIQDNAVLGGIRGTLADWNYDASVVWGRNVVEYTNTNTANITYLTATPTEFYGGELELSQTTANLDLSRLIPVDFLATPLSVAFGLEYRDENYSISPGSPTAFTNAFLLDANGDFILDGSGNPQFGDALLPVGSHPFAQGSLYFSENVDEGRDAVGIYAELDADVSDRWNITVAGRFEDYSDFGDTFNAKIASRFELTDGFAIRGSASTGFRAPSLQQQFFTSITTNFINGEAFDIGTIPATSPAAQALGGTQLQPEESTNLSIGATWTGLDNLTVTLDAYSIEIDDRVVLSETLGNSAAEAAIVNQVFADAGIVGVGAARFFINGVNSKTEGVDLTASYDMDLGDLGDLQLVGGLNYNTTDVSDVIASVGPASLFAPSDLFARRERERLENAAPETKANISANWSKDSWSGLLRANYYGDITQPGTSVAGDVSIDPTFIFDAEIGYEFSEKVRGAIGGNNILDAYPESSVERAGGIQNASQFAQIIPYAGFSPYGYQGRFVYVRLGVDF